MPNPPIRVLCGRPCPPASVRVLCAGPCPVKCAPARLLPLDKPAHGGDHVGLAFDVEEFEGVDDELRYAVFREEFGDLRAAQPFREAVLLRREDKILTLLPDMAIY